MSREDDVDRVLEWLIGTCLRVKALLEPGQELDRDELNAQMDSAIRVADHLRKGAGDVPVRASEGGSPALPAGVGLRFVRLP